MDSPPPPNELEQQQGMEVGERNSWYPPAVPPPLLPNAINGVVPMQDGRWAAQIRPTNGFRIWLGIFVTHREASRAYIRASMKLGIEGPHHQQHWPIAREHHLPHEFHFQDLFSAEEVLNMIKNDSYDNMFGQFLRLCGVYAWSLDPRFIVTDVAGKPFRFLFDKILTSCDVGVLNRLIVPKRYAERFFPGVGSETGGVLLTVRDRQAREWKFRYCHWEGSNSWVLTRGWNHYVKSKKLKVGDTLLFYMAADGSLLVDVVYDLSNCSGVHTAAMHAIMEAAHLLAPPPQDPDHLVHDAPNPNPIANAAAGRGRGRGRGGINGAGRGRGNVMLFGVMIN